MTKPKTILPTKTGFTVTQTPVTFFLGIFSATISKVLPSRQEEALGLGIVWYPNLIEQIIDDIRR
jgi:hypothetical protein